MNERRVLWLFGFILLLTGGLSLFVNGGLTKEWLINWLQNLHAEAIGAFAVFLVIELLLGRTKEHQADLRKIKEIKENLVRRFGYSSAETKEAADDLRHYGWLTDGSLNGMEFHETNLTEVNLYDASLIALKARNSSFIRANLFHASLQDANLDASDFFQANLSQADLRGARLNGASLEEANLNEAEFNTRTMLPDNTHWRPDTDLSRFTNKAHPEYYRIGQSTMYFHLR